MSLSKAEEDLYDRQIRLWGVAAQQKIRGSTVVITGLFTGVSQEVVKNLVLKGVGKIILVTSTTDDSDAAVGVSPVLEAIDSKKLLFTPSQTPISNEILVDCIIEQAKELNPSVDLVTMSSLDEAIQKASFCLVVQGSLSEACLVNDLCRQHKVPFEWIMTNFFTGILVNDFGSIWNYAEEHKKNFNGESINETIEKTMEFVNVKDLWCKHKEIGINWVPPKRKRSAIPSSYSPTFTLYQDQIEFTGNLGCDGEWPSVNAIIGAISAQEAVKAITQKDSPIHNVLLFDATNLDSTILSIISQ